MKFNEKLTELRKKQGLSQEELGNKLNVTRQTVSKWELGQTTPEMDKLVEMSKLFNISVDELVKETEEKNIENPVIEDQPIIDQTIKNEPENKNKMKNFIIIAIVIVGILICFGLWKEHRDRKILEQGKGIFDSVTNTAMDTFDKVKEKIEEEPDESSSEQRFLNSTLEMYGGRTTGMNALTVIDKVITNNKKDDRKITVKFMEQETSDSDEIKAMKSNIKENSDYDITYDYDENKLINRVVIEEVEKTNKNDEFERESLNSVLEMCGGRTTGMNVLTVIDKIITNNKKDDRKITVKFMEQETSNPDEINTMKKSIKTFSTTSNGQTNGFAYYDVTYDYDENGNIIKATIEEV